MKNRRRFFQTIGVHAVAATAIPRAVVSSAEESVPPVDYGNGQSVRVGIIGAENSHSISFGRIFNIEKKFPGVEAVAIWGETEEFARRSSERGQIETIVSNPADLLGMVDAVIVDHRHAKYHAAAAEPFIRAGIPTFIDKPFTYRVGEARHILDLAEEHKTPITSLSSVGYGPGTDDLASQTEELDEVLMLFMTGPAEITSKYGGVFFYGIHIVEQMFTLFGDDVSSVRATRHNDRTTFQFKFDSGRLATVLLTPERRDVVAVTPEGALRIEPRVDVENSIYMYSAIVKMFQTGEEPRSHSSILRTVATLQAMERSVQSEEWEKLLV